MPRIRTDAAKPVRVTASDRWPLSRLKLDFENVRLAHLPLQKRPKGERELEEFVWDQDGTKTLYQSIKAAQGLNEPLFVRPDGTVIEGNERLVSLRRLRREQLDGKIRAPDDAFDPVDVEIFPDGMSREEELILLARWHVGGKDQWRALNQAEVLYKLHHEYGYQIGRIADLVRMTKARVGQRISAYRRTKEFHAATGTDDPKYYSFLEELERKRDLRNWVDSSDANKQQLFDWIVGGRFNEWGPLDIRRLWDVLQDEDSKAAFANNGGDMKRALAVLRRKDPAYGSPVFQALAGAINAIREMPRSELTAIPRDENKKRVLLELRDELASLLRDLKIA